MHVALLEGSISSEHEVSLMTAKTIHQALLNLGYKVTVINPDRNISNAIKSLNPDVVFNALHGSFGENGVIPAILEMLEIPYTHSGVLSSAIAMDKIMTKRVAISCGIKTPQYIKMKASDMFDALERNQNPMPSPYVIKTINQGSSIGVYLIIQETDPRPIRSDWIFDDDALIEEYIPGKELSAVVFGDKALGVLELNPKGGFYDYKAKYVDGVTEHIYPANINDEVYRAAMERAELIHDTLGCRTTSRSDFRYNPDLPGLEGLFFLEINTHPGFTDTSIVPDIALKSGYTIEELVQQLIKDARCEIKG